MSKPAHVKSWRKTKPIAVRHGPGRQNRGVRARVSVAAGTQIPVIAANSCECGYKLDPATVGILKGMMIGQAPCPKCDRSIKIV